MTRRTRTNQSVGRRLGDLETATASTPPVEVVWRDARTGDLVDSDGTPVDADPEARTVVFSESVIMSRERAECEGYEILGPAEDTPPENDVVRVPRDGDWKEEWEET